MKKYSWSIALTVVACSVFCLSAFTDCGAQGYSSGGAGFPRSDGPQKMPLFRLLDTNGDGSGTTNAIGDYDPTAEIFYIQPPAGTVYRIARMIVHAEDGPSMTAEEYGNLGSALTNGIAVRVQDDSGTIVSLTDDFLIKSNAHWAAMCFDADVKTWGVTPSNELLAVRWTFTKAGQYIRLDGDNNERLEVLLNDEFDGLVSHYFFVQGYNE